MKFVYAVTAILMLVVGAGLWLVWLGGAQVVRAFESADWTTTEGVVILSEVTEADLNERQSTVDEAIRYYVEFEYDYEVDGVSYQGDCIAIGESGVRSRAEGERRIEPYPVGSQVTVYFDPKNPGDACLVSGATQSAWILLLAGLVTTVLALRLALSWIRESASFQSSSAGSE